MKIRTLLLIMVITSMALWLPSCGIGSDNNSENSDYFYNDSYDESDEYTASNAIAFHSSRDVYNYINGKTFSGDGINIRFYNNGQSVDVNGTNIANDVKIYGVGVNDNDVAYATIQISNPTGITTTFSLLAVEGHAQLIDPNDGAVYEY